MPTTHRLTHGLTHGLTLGLAHRLTRRLLIVMSMTTLLGLTVVLTVGGLTACQKNNWVAPGPSVGSQFPDSLSLNDQAGNAQSLKALMGSKGTAVFFVRSADWCPLCKGQLADANQHLAEFQALGLNVISVSHDTVPLIAAFHDTQKIGYTMLADPDGAIVEKLGIRDLQYADGSPAHGVAQPMIFVINPDMKITHKYAEEGYISRPDLNKVLADLRGQTAAT